MSGLLGQLRRVSLRAVRVTSMAVSIGVLTACSTGSPVSPALAPRVIEVRPAHLAESVTPDTNIVIRFDGEVSEDWSELTRVRFDPPVACDMRWHPEQHTLTCEPVIPLEYGTTYTLEVLDVELGVETQGLTSTSVNATTHTVTFSTRTSDATFENPTIVATEPEDGVWDVRTSFMQISIAFSEAMFVPSVESALSSEAIEFTPADGAAQSTLGCDSFSWSDDLTQVTCHFTNDAPGGYRLRMSSGAMAANGKPVLSPSDVHWNTANSPNRLQTTWTGTYVDARHGTYDVTVSFAMSGEVVAYMKFEDDQGERVYAGAMAPRLSFTPNPVRLGGATEGAIYMSDLYCGRGHFDVIGQIRDETWVGSIHASEPGGQQCWNNSFSHGTFSLTPSDTYIPPIRLYF